MKMRKNIHFPIWYHLNIKEHETGTKILFLARILLYQD